MSKQKDIDNIIAIKKAKDNAENKPVKRKRNRPDLAKFGEEYTEPGDNARYLRFARVSMNLPPIDISDPKQVENRINEYFDFCEQNDRKPNIKGVANWLGVSRDTVNSWKRGEYRTTTHSDLIKKAIDILEELWIDYMQNGKLNPVSGIFLGKALFGYQDKIDIAVQGGNADDNNMDAEDIAKRYLEDGRKVETTFADGQD